MMALLMQILSIAGPALMALLGLLAGKLIQYINGKHKNEYIKGMLERLNDSGLEVVKFTYQAFVGPIKASGRKLTDEEKKLAKSLALEELKGYYGLKGLKELAKVLGLTSEELDKKLERTVEAKVYEAKYG